MPSRHAGLLLAVLLSSAVAVAAPALDRALDAYEKGDYAAAFTPLLALAQGGNPVAQVYVGLMYFNAHGVGEDDIKSFAWFRRAAEQGYPEGQFQVGYMYLYGYGTPDDTSDPEGLAAEWLHRAAAQGHAEAQFNLGLLYLSGSGVPADHTTGMRWIEKAAAGGSPEAQRFSGHYN